MIVGKLSGSIAILLDAVNNLSDEREGEKLWIENMY